MLARNSRSIMDWRKYRPFFCVAKADVSVFLDSMSNSLLARATQALKAKVDAGKRLRAERQKEEEILFSGVGTLGGSGAAAIVDTKLGKNGQPHKLFAKADGTGGFPTNIAIGVAIAVPAIAIKNFPAKAPAAAAGLAMAGAGLYRYIVDQHAAAVAAGTTTP